MFHFVLWGFGMYRVIYYTQSSDGRIRGFHTKPIHKLKKAEKRLEEISKKKEVHGCGIEEYVQGIGWCVCTDTVSV